MANQAVITSLLGREDALFGDKLNHASLIDAATLSRARHLRYRHGDLDHLEHLLRTTKARARLIATDSVFSMEGDIAPVKDLLWLADRHGAWLYLDDAHGYGVLGAEGRGVLEHFQLPDDVLAHPALIYMATLGKALGVAGAFIAANHEIVEWLVNKARAYIYTTAMPAALASAVSSAVHLVVAEPWRRQRLRTHIDRLSRTTLTPELNLLKSETPIQSLILGAESNAMAAHQKLLEHGLYVPAIRPPTVPIGTARLRISLSAIHDDADIDQLQAALSQITHD
jgi:8-amino-7-oxononanoate synthase